MKAAAWLLVACVAGACSGNGGDKADAATSSVDGGTACPDNAAPGLQQSVGGMTMTVDSLTPEPAEKGDNTWVMVLKNASAADVTGAVVTFRPVMPLHGHGTTPAVITGTEVSPGHYSVGPFNLFMPGSWNVPVLVQQTGMPDVEFTFHACISG